MQGVKEGKDFHFPTEEVEVLKFWDAIDAFKEQLRRSEGKPEYIFYDGPPFATGLPHYGHLLAGTLKVGGAGRGGTGRGGTGQAILNVLAAGRLGAGQGCQTAGRAHGARFCAMPTASLRVASMPPRAAGRARRRTL